MQKENDAMGNKKQPVSVYHDGLLSAKRKARRERALDGFYRASTAAGIWYLCFCAVAYMGFAIGGGAAIGLMFAVAAIQAAITTYVMAGTTVAVLFEDDDVADGSAQSGNAENVERS